MIEFWTRAAGYEGLYEVSDMGRIRSVARRVPCIHGSRISPARVLKVRFPGVKYYSVQLFRNGQNKTFYVHRMVLLSFIGPPTPGQETCHQNGDCHDNRLVNLRWGTRKENRADGRRLGEIPLGEHRAFAKLKPEQVVNIRLRVAAGESHRAVAQGFGISPMTVGKIVRRESWRHVA